MAGVGVLAFLWLSRSIACVVWGASSVIVVTALASPTGLYASLERGLAELGRVAGRGLNWVILAPLFYLVFFPFGLLFRRGGKDRLKRHFEPEASTYWEPHREPTTASPWERQF